MVRSYFEDYKSSKWQIIGLFTDKKVAGETAKKWKDFYEEKQSLFDEPKDWGPTDADLVFSDGDWKESYEYPTRVSEYRDILEFDLNKDLSLNNTTFTNEIILSLMTQWDRNHKLEKITNK